MQTFPWWDLLLISINWGQREETLEACAARLSRHASLLKPLQPALTGLRADWGANGQLISPNVAGQDCVPMFLRAKYGFQFQGGVEFGPEHFLSLEILAGAGRDASPEDRPHRFSTNRLTLSATVKDVTGEDAAIIAALKPMLLAGIEAWEPDCAALYSHYYKQLTHTPGKWPPYASGSWAIYLARQLAEQISPPAGCVAETTSAGGILMMATDGFFTHEDTELRARAEAIHTAVESLGL